MGDGGGCGTSHVNNHQTSRTCVQRAERAERHGHIGYLFSHYTQAIVVQRIIVWFLRLSVPVMSSVQSLFMHFLFYIINNAGQLNARNPCGLHMESCWVNSYSLCSEVESMLSRWSNWSPAGLHMDSTWILDKKLAGLPPKKKSLKSTWTPGIDLDSTWNLWGRVKSSAQSSVSSQV